MIRWSKLTSGQTFYKIILIFRRDNFFLIQIGNRDVHQFTKSHCLLPLGSWKKEQIWYYHLFNFMNFILYQIYPYFFLTKPVSTILSKVKYILWKIRCLYNIKIEIANEVRESPLLWIIIRYEWSKPAWSVICPSECNVVYVAI